MGRASDKFLKNHCLDCLLIPSVSQGAFSWLLEKANMVQQKLFREEILPWGCMDLHMPKVYQ